MMIPWITLWGYGSDINAAGKMLFVRNKKSKSPDCYPLDDISHILIAGNHVLHTAVIEKCASKNIPISFFDIRGNPTGTLFSHEKPHLTELQRDIPIHSFALSMIISATEARMRFLHDLSEGKEGIYYKGEFDIMSQTRSELDYLITIPELSRAFTLTRDMYYEILSRVIPKNLGFRRRNEGIPQDPVNLLFSIGYAMLYARTEIACIGVGLNPDIGSLYGLGIPCSRGACVREIMEPALVPVVDKVVVKIAQEGILSNAIRSGERYILPETVENRFKELFSKALDAAKIEENVIMYAEAVKAQTAPRYHYPL